MAGGLGFDPRLTESESAVLPLTYPPVRKTYAPALIPADLGHLAALSKPHQQCPSRWCGGPRSRGAAARDPQRNGGQNHPRAGGDGEEEPARVPRAEGTREEPRRHPTPHMGG